MKTEALEIDGKRYEVRELTLEEGMPLLTKSDGNMDIATLIRTATTINGQPAQTGEISMSVAMKLMPIVLKMNSFNAEAPGNA